MLNDNITEETSMLCILVSEISWLWESVLAGLLDVSQAIWDAHWALTACFGRQNCCSQHQTIYCTHKLKNKHVLAHLIGEESIKITLKCKMKVYSSLQCTSTEAQWRQAISVCAADILPALEALWVSSHALFHRATAVFPAGPLRVGRNLWRSCVN